MFEAKDVITDAVRNVTTLITSHKRDEVVSWEAIESAAGFKRKTQHWPAFAARLRRDLRDVHGLTLKAVPGVGWRLTTIPEQILGIDRQRRALRQHRKGIKETEAVPDGGLSDHYRNVKHRRLDIAKNAVRATNYALRVAHTLAKPSKVN